MKLICSDCGMDVQFFGIDYKLWRHTGDGSLMCEDAKAIEPEPTPEPQASGESTCKYGCAEMQYDTRCEVHKPNPVDLGDFVNQTLKMWEEAAETPEMKGVRFDAAAEILRNTYSVKEMASEGSEPLERYCVYCGSTEHPTGEHKRVPGPPAVPRWCAYCHGHYAGDFLIHEPGCPEAAPAEPPAPRQQCHAWANTIAEGPAGAEPEPPRGGTEPPELVDIIEVVIPRGKGEWVRDRIKECFGWDAYLQVTRPSSPIPALGVRELAKVLRDAWNTGDKGTWVNVAKAAIEALKPVGVLPSEWVSGAVELLDKALLGKIDAEWHDRAIVLLSETPLAALGQQEGE